MVLLSNTNNVAMELATAGLFLVTPKQVLTAHHPNEVRYTVNEVVDVMLTGEIYCRVAGFQTSSQF